MRIFKATEVKRIKTVDPLAEYDLGEALLENGETVKIMWGGPAGNLDHATMMAIGVCQPERNFIAFGKVYDDGQAREAYAPILFNHEL